MFGFKIIKKFIGYCLSYCFMYIGNGFCWLDDGYDNDCSWTYKALNFCFIVSDRLQEWGGAGPWKFLKISQEKLDKKD